jgi:D-amino peptidase
LEVYVSIDLEGVAGIVAAEQVIPAPTDEYRQARRLMTEEANAAVRAAVAEGATRIVVNDSHARMLNLDPELLDPRAECSIGFPKPFYMMAGIAPRFDAALFVGYHGGAGSAPAILDHTYSGRAFHAVRLNGVRQTETTLNAALAGHHGVPVALVCGDEATCAEARATLGPDLPTVATKAAFGSEAAYTLHPTIARERITAAARDGLQRVRAGHLRPFVVEPPYVLECDIHTTLAADYASTIPGVERPAGRTLRFTHDDYPTVFRALLTMAMLGGLAGR